MFYCSSLFFSSSRSSLNVSCIISILASILFLRSLIIFTINLNYSSGRLAIFISLSCSGFHLVPLSGTYSFSTSFWLTFCDCSFCSTGRRSGSSVCPCWLRPSKRFVQASWWEGWFWPVVGRAGFRPSGAQGHVQGVFKPLVCWRGRCVPAPLVVWLEVT